MRLILASQSPRRKQILSRLDIPFDIIVSDVDESQFKFEGNPIAYCELLAEVKAEFVSKQYPDAIVIGADTIVVLEDDVLEKPIDKADANRILNLLSNKTHIVYTAVSIQSISKDIHHTFHEATKVTFRKLSSKMIHYYIDNFAPFDKAGSYGIQDWSALFVKYIHGCYDNVVGFPLSKFYEETKHLNIHEFS